MTEELITEVAPAVDDGKPVVANTPALRQALRNRYAAPEWALMEEVAPATGGGTRYADGVAVNLWSSRGHSIHGFEIKASRSDWLRELKDPSKAEPVFRYCDHWFIVAPRGIVKEGELPPTWGLLEMRSDGLLVAKTHAPKLEAQPVSRAFFASMMRRGYELLDRAAERKISEARMTARNEMNDEVARRVKDSTRELDELRKQLAALKEETGIEISRYSGPPKDIIKLAQKLQHVGGYYGSGDGLAGLTSLADRLDQAAKTVRDGLAECGMGPEVVKQ